MMHRDYLKLYTCGGQSDALGVETPHIGAVDLQHLILATVEKEFNCEDIGINFIASAALSSSGSLRNEAEPSTKQAAPLFVRPLQKIGDFGKMGMSGLHLKQSHLATRTDCLNKMNALLFNITGKNLPVQTRIVSIATGDFDGDLGGLIIEKYAGLTTRLHEDCTEIEDGHGSLQQKRKRRFFRKVTSSACSFRLAYD